jgi:ubiquitin carboxyl-terminal hydrolase 22/27/51
MGKNGFVKNNLKVAFDEILDLEEFVGVEVLYRLLGFVSHYGTMDTGHYTSVCRVLDEYCFFDDESVTAISFERARLLQPYLLFYERIQ